MNRARICADLDVWAGNVVRIGVVAHAPAGSGSVNPSTARVAVTDINGVSVGLDETVSYNGDETAVLIDTFWDIPADQRGGMHTVTITVSGNLIGATERYIRVKARTLAVVPA